MGIISRIAHLLPQSIKLNLYYSLVYPYLSYCNLIWALTYPSRLKGLIILQKRAVRVIAGASRREHSAPLFSKFKILTINEIGELQVGEFFFRLEHGLLPPVFKNFLPHVGDIHTHYTRNASLYRSVKCHSNVRLHTIKSQGVQIWNRIPMDIRLCKNVFIFKRKFRSHLLARLHLHS